MEHEQRLLDKIQKLLNEMEIEPEIKLAHKVVREALTNCPEINQEQALIGNFLTRLVGSSYYKNRISNDVDVLVYCPVNNVCGLYFEGWDEGGSVKDCYTREWVSYTKQVGNVKVNMLLTNDSWYYALWCAASEVCKFLHLMGVALPTGVAHGVHAIIMDNKKAEAEAKIRGYDT